MARRPSARDLAEIAAGKGSARDRLEAAVRKVRKKRNSTKKRKVKRAR